MAKEDDASVVEDALQGSSEDIVDTDVQMDLPDLDIGINAEPETEDAPDESTDESTDETEDESEPFVLHWDRKRQQADQESANNRDRLTKAEHTIEELRAAIAGSPTKYVDAATEALAALEAPEPLGEFAEDDEKAAHKAAVKDYRAEKVRLAGEIKKLSDEAVKAAKPKPVTDTPPDTTDDSDATKADFDEACREAAIEYGAQHDEVARASVAKEIQRLGFPEDRGPTKAQMQKIVTRVYRATADRAKPKAATPEPQPRREPTRTEAKPKGRESFDELVARDAADQRRAKRNK